MILVDSNVLLDIVTDDPVWAEWSTRRLEAYAETHELAINPVIFSEISVGFRRIEEVEHAFPSSLFLRLPLPWEAAFLAGKAFLSYKKHGGTRRSPLPDFFIGAHASVLGIPLLTRDAERYRTYFPKLEILSP